MEAEAVYLMEDHPRNVISRPVEQRQKTQPPSSDQRIKCGKKRERMVSRKPKEKKCQGGRFHVNKDCREVRSY